MLRIYCDFNDRIDERRFTLACAGAQRDIEKYSDELVDGLRVILYQTDEFEVEGTIFFDQEWKTWIGAADWNTIQYLDGFQDT